jgi:uncharacterized repeat protein (TIGR01451 family)/fimbrial isopeptide formation D2 family protein
MRSKLFISLALLIVALQAIPANAAPNVKVSVSNEVLLGEDFVVTVTFDNTGGTVGFGPFVDLVLPAGGIDYNDSSGPCDGITFVSGSAQMVGVNGGPLPLTTDVVNAPCTHTTAGACAILTHPYSLNGISSVSSPNILVPEGAQLVTIKLPFGMFQPNQPPVVIQVKAHVSPLADVNALLNIYARGGFQFGGNPNNDPTTDPPAPLLSTGGVTDCTTWNAVAPVTPVLFTFKVEDRLSATPGPCFDGVDNGNEGLTDSDDPECNNGKTYNGPEDETATGPNFPHRYRIILNIANGMIVKNLNVQECLPNNMVLKSVVTASTLPVPSSISPSAPFGPANSPNNCMSFKYNSITGNPTAKDIVIDVEFYIPEKDANGAPILGQDCKNAQSIDDVKAEGDWAPLDPRDWGGSTTPVLQHVTSDASAQDHVLTDKHLAIQKSVKVMPNPAGPLRPGKILEYTLDCQVSDFFTFGGIVVTDVLSDGQTLLTAPPVYAPKMTVRDRRGPPTMVPFSIGAGNLADWPNPFVDCAGVHGGRSLIFQVSVAMQNNATLFTSPVLKAGILSGGYSFLPVSPIPATIKIVFYAQVQDTFAHPHPPGDKFVDKHDPLNNCVTVSADMYKNDSIAPTLLVPQMRCTDDSTTRLRLPGDVLKKKIYARNGSTTDPELSNNPPRFAAGDTITYRITKTLPSADYENLTITDWPPLPALSVTGLTLASTASTAIPPPGVVSRFLPGHTLAVTPTLTVNADNSFTLDYSSSNNTANTPKTIDLLVTFKVSADPYADGLFFTNEAQECETDTFGKQFCQVAVARLQLTEPNVRIRKGVIATDNPNSIFSPGPRVPTSAMPVTALTNMGGSCTGCTPVWTTGATINSTSLSNPNVFNSDLYHADAGDWITYAIVLENRGSGIHGAFDVTFRDMTHPGFAPPPGTWNLRAHDGTGAPFTLLPSGVFGLLTAGGEKLQDPGPTPLIDLGGLDRFSLTSGRNLAIITYNLHLAQPNQVKIGDCYPNTAELINYAAIASGPNFVTAGFTPPFTETAKVCIDPTLEKSIVATSETHTVPQTAPPGTPQVAIGEIVRYRLLVRLPEGFGPSFKVTDTLAPGMKFLNDGSARLAFISNGIPAPSITHSPLFGPPFDKVGNTPLTSAALSALPAIPPGAITGGLNCGDPVTFDLGNVQNNDNDADLEYVEIEFNALVCNVTGNQGTPPTTLSNTFSVSVGGANIATSNPVDVVVVEPNLKITKIVSPATLIQSGTVTYTVTITNTGTADAFDLQFTDGLSPGLTLVPGSVGVTGGCSSPVINSTSPWVTCSSLPVNGVMTIKYKATANPGTCPATLPNRATIIWTSLPGPNGTIGNPTGSNTPGSPGAPDGERDGVTPPTALNDYVAVASVPLIINCPPCTQAPPGMVSWWPGDGNANDIQDGNHGTLKNNPTFVPGKVGQAFGFDGIDDYVEIAHSPTLDVGTGHTVDLWVKVDGYPLAGKYSVLVNKWVNGLEDKLLEIDSTGRVLYYLYSSVSSFGGVPLAGPVLTVGTWYHVAATYDGSAAKIYINGGPPIASKPASGDIGDDNKGKLYFGHNPGRVTIGEPFVPFKGQLDEIEWYNRALTMAEVAAIFNAGSGGKCKCSFLTNETITCNANGTFNYTSTLTNLSNFTASTVSVAPITGNVTVSPSSIPVSLPPGGSTTVTMTIGGSGAVSGANVCLSIGLLSPGTVGACRQPHCITLPACQPIVCAPQPPHMVSWWPLNETSGNIVVDLKGAHNGTTTPGSIGMAGGNPTSAPLPKVGNALYFTNSNATVPGSPYNFGNGSFSIDAWVRGSQLTNASMGIVDKLDPAANPRTGFAFFVLGGKLQLLMGDGTAAGATYSSSGSNGAFTYSNTLWQHVAVTVQRSASGVAIGTFYINGAPAGTFGPPPNSVNNGVPLLIGSSRLNSPNCQSCEVALDEVEIFDEVVAASDIQAIFAAGSKGKCP